MPLNNYDFHENLFRRGHIPTERLEWNFAYIFCNVHPIFKMANNSVRCVQNVVEVIVSLVKTDIVGAYFI